MVFHKFYFAILFLKVIFCFSVNVRSSKRLLRLNRIIEKEVLKLEISNYSTYKSWKAVTENGHFSTKSLAIAVCVIVVVIK